MTSMQMEYIELLRQKERNRKGDDDMCNLSQGIYNDGFAIGKAEGRAEGKIEAKLEVVKKLLAKEFSLADALAIADIDKETYEKYSAKEN